MSDSERIAAYSEAVNNFDLIHNLPPKNLDIDSFSSDQKMKLDKLCAKDSFLTPIIFNNKISHFEVNKKILKKSIILSNAKTVYRNQYLRNIHNRSEKATFVVINIFVLMSCVVLADSETLLLFISDQKLLNIIMASGYLSMSLVFFVYYFSINFIVFSVDIVNDIALGITEAYPTLIGSKV